MRVALDHDSTLAATADTALALIGEDDYSYTDIESWDWGLETFGRLRFLDALWHTWTLRPMSVDPMEPNVDEAIADLHALDAVDRIDIVTQHPDRPGISGGKQRWLDAQDIAYDEFVHVTDHEKGQLDYDIFIDDRPGLPESVNAMRPEATILLRDQPYNRDADGEYVRIESLFEAPDALSA